MRDLLGGGSLAVGLACLSLPAALLAGAAQAQGADVAFVEAVAGHVTASYFGADRDLDALDTVNASTQVEVDAGSELRLCHYGVRQLLTIKGPVKATVTQAGVDLGSGKVLAYSGTGCAAPVVSTVQGGIVFRNALTPPTIGLAPRLKISLQEGATIRHAVLWDGKREKALAEFQGLTLQPKLEDGAAYLLVIDLDRGGQQTTSFRASAASRENTLILVVR